MAVTRERFDQGLTVDAYKAQMKQNRETFEANERKATIAPNDLTFFSGLAEPLNVLVITEDWCGDAIANVPVLAKLAEATGKLNIHIFLRDQNLDLADQYLKEGKYRSVPVFVFFDASMRELGHFIERPVRATKEMDIAREHLVADHPELPDLGGDFDTMSEQSRNLRMENLRNLRNERGAVWSQMLIDDIKELLGTAGAR